MCFLFLVSFEINNFLTLTNLMFQLPSDMKIEWSARMRSTAGFCRLKRIKTIIGPNNECPRYSIIVLSSKVCQESAVFLYDFYSKIFCRLTSS